MLGCIGAGDVAEGPVHLLRVQGPVEAGPLSLQGVVHGRGQGVEVTRVIIPNAQIRDAFKRIVVRLSLPGVCSPVSPSAVNLVHVHVQSSRAGD